MTLQTQHVLREFLQDPGRELYGLEIIAATALPTGTIYPILARLEKLRWIESRWEDPDTAESASRPRRRYYKITAEGVRCGREAVARTYQARRQPLPRWLPDAHAPGGTT